MVLAFRVQRGTAGLERTFTGRKFWTANAALLGESMLGTAPLQAPWGATPSRSRPPPGRPWQVVRRASSPARGSSPQRSSHDNNCSRWEPVTPKFERDSLPAPRLSEAAAARTTGLDADESLSWFDSCDPAVGLTPQELIERQAQRGKLAQLRLERERAVAREGAALKREKAAYARALGAAASLRAVEQMRQDRGFASGMSMLSEDSRAVLSACSIQYDGESGASGCGSSSGGGGGIGSAPGQGFTRPLSGVRWAEVGAQADDKRPVRPAWDDKRPVRPTWDEERDELDSVESAGERWRAASATHGDNSGAGASSARNASSWALTSAVSSARIAAPPQIEKLHRGEPIVMPTPSAHTQLERALERGRAAMQRQLLETEKAARDAENARTHRHVAREMGQAASMYAIEQIRQHQPSAKPATHKPPTKEAPAGQGEGDSATTATGASEAAPSSETPKGAVSGATSGMGSSPTLTTGAGAGAGAHANSPRAHRPRAGFGSSSARCPGSDHWCAHTTAQSQPTPKRPVSPARPLSPRLMRPTASLKAHLAELPGTSGSFIGTVVGAPPAFGTSASRTCLKGDNTTSGAVLSTTSGGASSATTLRSATPASSGSPRAAWRPAGASTGGRTGGTGALTALHELAPDLAPIDRYHTLAMKARQSAVSSGRPGSAASPAARAAAKAAAKALLQATGATAWTGGAMRYPPTPSAAASLIQSGYRGMKSREVARRQKAARLVQKRIRVFLARRRRARMLRNSKLYAQKTANLHFSRRMSDGGGGSLEAAARMAAERVREASLQAVKGINVKGRWAEKAPAVLSLPKAGTLAKAPPSPTGRLAHERLHQHAGERAERLRNRTAEKVEQEELKHVAACTFSPATNRRHVSKPPQSSEERLQAFRTASPARAPAKDANSTKEPAQQKPRTAAQGLTQGLTVSPPEDAVPGGGEGGWKTVASTGSLYGYARS